MDPSRHTPAGLALGEKRRADAWRILSIVVCLASMAGAYLIVRAGRSSERILVLDSQGNVLAGPVEALASSQGFFHTSALCAANAALQRSGAGFDLYELLRLYFGPRALQKLEDDLHRRIEDMRRRNLQQKPIVDSVAAPVVAGDARLVEVRGRLITAGAFGGQAFYQEPAFALLLTYRRNPNLGQVGAYPWICEDVELKIDENES